MKTIETKVYQFSELSEEAKKKAIENLQDINVNHHDWWKFTYDDADQVGIEITGFDVYHNKISGNMFWDAIDVKKAILKNHGKKCDTYKTAKSFDLRKNDFDANDFEYALLQDYLSLLSEEYDYLTSKQAIIETIEANEYDFTEDGKLF